MSVAAPFPDHRESLPQRQQWIVVGELDRAVEYFKKGMASESAIGYDQFVRWDLDLEPLWDYPPFREMVGWDD